jgi:hypothetical protein
MAKIGTKIVHTRTWYEDSKKIDKEFDMGVERSAIL